VNPCAPERSAGAPHGGGLPWPEAGARGGPQEPEVTSLSAGGDSFGEAARIRPEALAAASLSVSVLRCA